MTLGQGLNDLMISGRPHFVQFDMRPVFCSPQINLQLLQYGRENLLRVDTLTFFVHSYLISSIVGSNTKTQR